MNSAPLTEIIAVCFGVTNAYILSTIDLSPAHNNTSSFVN
jgi:hypothetical protein